MDQSGISNPVAQAQSSIRSFFQPPPPTYSTPPSNVTAAAKLNGSSIPDKTLMPSPPPVPKAVPKAPFLNPPDPALPSQASISTIHEKHIQPLKRINSLLLCINYPDSFYKTILDPKTSPNFSRVILWQDAQDPEPKVVGGMVCRLDRDEATKTSHIYIQSLALLSPYRHLGLATALLEVVVAATISQPLTDYPIASLYAHVWTENIDGLEWYKGRRFSQEAPVLQNYYRKLKPDTAWVLRRPVLPSDHIRSAPQSVQPTTTLKPEPAVRAASYQKQRPDTEWNDLPSDILQPSRSNTPNLLSIPVDKSGPPSSASSRSSSRNGLGKKKRQYPVGAFEAANGSGGSG